LQWDLVAVSGANQYRVKPLALVSTEAPACPAGACHLIPITFHRPAHE
jgi:hypothetical protein